MKFTLRRRFSLRAIAILVTLVGVYVAAWEATKRHANSYDPSSFKRMPGNEAVIDASAPMPFLLVRHEVTVENDGDVGWTRYYFWFFGYLAKLPYEKNDGYVLTY